EVTNAFQHLRATDIELRHGILPHTMVCSAFACLSHVVSIHPNSCETRTQPDGRWRSGTGRCDAGWTAFVAGCDVSATGWTEPYGSRRCRTPDGIRWPDHGRDRTRTAVSRPREVTRSD